MNPNYSCIDFESSLEPDEMLARLRQRFPEANWHGSDTETQGPSLSSIPEDKPHLQIFFEDRNCKFCMNFWPVGLNGVELEKYKIRYITYIRDQVLPLLTA